MWRTLLCILRSRGVNMLRYLFIVLTAKLNDDDVDDDDLVH